MVNDDKQLTRIADLEKIRSQRRLTNTLNNLVDEAASGNLRCAAIRMFYKDGTSKIHVIGGTPEEQAEALARLEAEETRVKALIDELRPIVDEVFAHLPEDERQRVLNSPERLRLALNTLSDDQLPKLSPSTQERYKKLLDELLSMMNKTI